MELIVINENKLKIMMSAPDMDALGIDENKFYLSSFNARDMLARILKNSNVKTDFEYLSSQDKILLQLYPDIHGGCELFVTRITLDGEEDFFMTQSDEGFLLPKPIPKNIDHKKTALTYSFTQLDHLIAACRELIKQNFNGESYLYRLDDGKYLLFITGEKGTNIQTDFLSEFGQFENTENSYFRSLERGTFIIHKNAIEKIATI